MRGMSQLNKKIIGIIVGIIIVIVAGTTVYVSMSSNTLSWVTKDEPSKKVSTNEESSPKEDSDKDKNDSISESTPTSSEPTTEEKYFISENHKFYNNTTGYGKINSLTLSEQKKNAEGIIQLLPKLESSTALQTDLNRIRLLAENIVNGKNDLKSNVLYLHRMFHDLDVFVNKFTHKDEFKVTDFGNGRKTNQVTRLIDETE